MNLENDRDKLDKNNDYDDSYLESDSEEETSETTYDTHEIPEINEIELSKKETFYFKIIDKYYRNLDPKKVETMIDIIEGKSKISLRLLDWFVTRYANKHKIRFETEVKNTDKDKFDQGVDKSFNVHISYKAQLKSYKKKYFDPFRRRKKFKYYFDKEKKNILCTTIGQLNFFKWAFTNDIINYVFDNYTAISKVMMNTNKIDKKRKLKDKKEKKNKHDSASKIQQEISVKKNGINIIAKKQIKNDEVKIILSFD